MDDKRVSGSPARDPLTKNRITRQNNCITSVGNLSRSEEHTSELQSQPKAL